MGEDALKYRIFRLVVDTGERVLEKTPGADWLKVTGYALKSRRIPKSFDGFRFVVLADIHAHRFGKDHEILLSRIRQLQPELILNAGDWVRDDYYGRDAALLRELAAGLVRIAPTISILGNHEGRADHKDEFIADMRDTGMRILMDETMLLTKEEASIQLTGLYPSYENDYYGSLRDRGIGEKLKTEYREVMESLPEKGAFQIVLSHRPELFPLYGELGMDLVFSGHAHGGLMRLPGGKRLLAPDQGLDPVYTHGVYRQGKTTMIVSEGMGGPRIGIRPELIVVKLLAEE